VNIFDPSNITMTQAGIHDCTVCTSHQNRYIHCIGWWLIHFIIAILAGCWRINASRYYRALESVSIVSALSTTITIYTCQIQVHQRWQSKLQLPTARKKEWRPATADSSPKAVTCQHCDTDYFSRPRTRNLPIVVRRATSSTTDSPNHHDL